jgi:16S rRNA (cytidine1402-2'-O)-methyltransferase
MVHDPPSAQAQKLRLLRVLGHDVPAREPPPGLYLVATPIGNLGDVTLRALETLAGAQTVACEDSRVTRRLFDRYGITTPLLPYHDHNAEAVRPKILALLAGGAAVALVSDAGTPLISDPGFKLVQAAQAAGHTCHRRARTVGGAGGADGVGPADRPVLLRGLSAAAGSGAARAHRRTRGRAWEPGFF